MGRRSGPAVDLGRLDGCADLEALEEEEARVCHPPLTYPLLKNP